MKTFNKIKSISTATLLLSALLHSNFANAAVESLRCQKSGDNLDGPQAVARTKWAIKCFPQYRGMFGNSTTGGIDMVHPNGQIVVGYPTFAIVDGNGEVTQYWKAPIDEAASCAGSSQYSVVGFCLGGCYTPDQQVLFVDGYRAIGEAQSKLQTEVMALAPGASFERLAYSARPLQQIVTDLEPGRETILTIKTQSGGELKVTKNHPLVDGEGRMRNADTLKIGESLVRENGETDAITSVNREAYYGKVYNVKIEGSDPLQQIVLAQGYLNGSIHYQNEGVRERNRELLRRTALISAWVLKGEQ